MFIIRNKYKQSRLFLNTLHFSFKALSVNELTNVINNQRNYRQTSVYSKLIIFLSSQCDLKYYSFDEHVNLCNYLLKLDLTNSNIMFYNNVYRSFYKDNTEINSIEFIKSG